MNEGTGSNVADSSGNGNNGTLPNGGSWSSGVASNALVLDGVNDYVDIGDSATLENNATFTFSAWINPDQFFSSRDNYLMYKDKVLRWGFFAATSRQPSVDAGSGSGNPGWQGSVTSSTQLDSNVWTHIAVTYTNNTVKFYVNGLLTDTVTKTYTMGSNNKAYSLSTATQSFDGKLDDVRYYNRALSDSEISQVYGEQSTNRVYMADALGSIVALTDSAKAILTEYDYEPFGATTASGASSANAYKFTAREDDGTGLYFYRARYYHPVLGRFVGEDPIEFLGGDLNLFAYSDDDPVNTTDILGLSTDKYVPDRYKHGGPHIDRYTKDGRLVGRYRPDGTPIEQFGKCPKRIPKSDLLRFMRGVDKLLRALEVLSYVPYIDYYELLRNPIHPVEIESSCDGDCPPGYVPVDSTDPNGCKTKKCIRSDHYS